MPIKPFQLEDLTATLQVPIPGIPGAYGEIEFDAGGTATIALGAEVPVPLLDDAINGEIQVEIDKNGEIAYGIELNLVGLSIEAMVRGCDIVVDVGYGLLTTQAVFPIPDCEQPPPPLPIPLPPPGGDEDWGTTRELTPLPPPDYPDDTRIMALIYTSQAESSLVKTYSSTSSDSDGNNASYSSFEETKQFYARNLVTWHPEKGTELKSYSSNFTYTFTDSDGKNENRADGSDGIDGWVNGKSTRPYDLLDFTLPGSPEAEIFRIPQYWSYRRNFAGNSWGVSTPPTMAGAGISNASWVFVGTVAQLKAAMAQHPYAYSNVVDTRRSGHTYTTSRYWDGLTSFATVGSGVQRYLITNQTIFPYSYDYRLSSKTYTWLNTVSVHSVSEERTAITRTMVVRKIDVNKMPLMQGEPPVKDCCADIKAQLKRLRKDVAEIHATFNPKGFTEKILPPKFDDEGNLIKPSNNPVTLPEVLQELTLQGGGGSYEPQLIEIDKENIPASWEELKKAQELPSEKINQEQVFREMFKLLHEIRYVVDPDDVKQSLIPSRFIYPGVRSGYEHAATYPQLLKYLFLMLDKVGFQPFQVVVEDSNPAKAGNQTERQEYHSMGAALESITKYLIDIEGDQDAHTSFLVRLAYEVIIMHQINADTQQTVQNIQDFLGYEVKKKKESIPMAFNPLADNPSARKDVDQNTEESIEKLLPNLLKNGNAQVTMDEYVGRKDLVDFLFEILNAARQKPKGNRLA